MLERAGVGGRRLFAVDGAAASDRRVGCRLLRSWPAHLCGPRRYRLYAVAGAGLVEAAASPRDRRPALRSDSSRRGPPPRRPLGGAKTVIEANLRGWTADGLVRQAAF